MPRETQDQEWHWQRDSSFTPTAFTQLKHLTFVACRVELGQRLLHKIIKYINASHLRLYYKIG